MANTKSFTVRSAYDVLNVIVNGLTDDAIAEAMREAGIDYENATPDTFRAKFEKMSVSAHKNTTRKSSDTPTKTQIQNINYAKKVFDFMNENPDTVLTTKVVCDVVPYVTTSQKASAVINVLLKDGSVVKAGKADGRVTYKLADNESEVSED